jgi:peptide/nickel transport system substrate-binding protein
LVQRETEGKLKILLGQGPEWEHISFGIRPASYDDGYNPGAGDRPDLFGDPRTRQAFAYCIDRAAINNNLLYGRSTVPTSFLPANHPLAQAGLPEYAFNPQEGQALLDAAGWLDQDGDPGTPRVAAGVTGVPDGTPLSVTYATTEAGLRRQVAQAVTESLAGCGIGVQQQIYNTGEIFAPGPDGLVFGRKFDLVQFSWEASARPNCLLYASTQIPNGGNHWIGANVAGYSNPDFDAACAQASQARPTDAEYAARSQRVQALFAETLPVIPLYAHLKIAIARPDLCGLELDVTARSIFYQVESLDYGENCQ